MGLRPLYIFAFFQRGDRLYAAESDIYRRQILRYKDPPPGLKGLTSVVVPWVPAWTVRMDFISSIYYMYVKWSNYTAYDLQNFQGYNMYKDSVGLC